MQLLGQLHRAHFELADHFQRLGLLGMPLLERGQSQEEGGDVLAGLVVELQGEPGEVGPRLSVRLTTFTSQAR